MNFCINDLCPMYARPQSGKRNAPCIECGRRTQKGDDEPLALTSQGWEATVEHHKLDMFQTSGAGQVHPPLLRMRPEFQNKDAPTPYTPYSIGSKTRYISKGVERFEHERVAILRGLLGLQEKMQAIKSAMWSTTRSEVIYPKFISVTSDYHAKLLKLIKRHQELVTKSYRKELVSFFFSLLQDAVTEAVGGIISKQRVALEKFELQKDYKAGVARENIERLEQNITDTTGKLGKTPLVKYLLSLAHQLVTVALEMPIAVHRKVRVVMPTVPDNLTADMTVSEFAAAFVDQNYKELGLTKLLLQLRSVASLRYLLGLASCVENIDKREEALFRDLIDLDTSGFSNPGDFDVLDLVQRGLSGIAQTEVQKSIKALIDQILLDYAWVNVALEEVIELDSYLRLRLIGESNRTSCFVQRTKQSGDSNGMSVALTCFPDTELVFLTNFGDLESAKSILRFYRACGVGKDRIRVGVVFSEKQKNIDRDAVEKQLVAYTSRRVELLRYSGGADTLYQELVNPNYIKNDPFARLLIDLHFDSFRYTYREVGASTESIRRWIVEHSEGSYQISARIHQALAVGISKDDEQVISKFTKDFIQNLRRHHLHKGTGPRNVLVQPKKSSTVLEIEKPRLRTRPRSLSLPSLRDLKPPLVILFWVRGPQGDEGKNPELRNDQGIFRHVPTTGKPWHHATKQLYLTMKAIARSLSLRLDAPVYLVPIGDVLQSDFHYKISRNDPQEIGPKEHNLIEFFTRLREFTGRNRFNQFYFLYDLLRQSGIHFVQVGLRSGAIEQGMYLGMPTVYIDIDTESIQSVKKGEPDTTERMFKMTAEAKSPVFPMFHCLFSKNVIGTYPRQIDPELSSKSQFSIYTDQSLRETLARQVVIALGNTPKSKNKKDKKLDELMYGSTLGTLRDDEIREMFNLLVGIYTGYPAHQEKMKLWVSKTGLEQLKLSPGSKESFESGGGSSNSSVTTKISKIVVGKQKSRIDGSSSLVTGGGTDLAGFQRLVCLRQVSNTCGQRAAYNALCLAGNPALPPTLDNGALHAIGPMDVDIDDNAIRQMLDDNGGRDIAIISDLRRVKNILRDQTNITDDGDYALFGFAWGQRRRAVVVLNTLAMGVQEFERSGDARVGHYIAVELIWDDDWMISIRYIDSLLGGSRTMLLRGLVRELENMGLL